MSNMNLNLGGLFGALAGAAVLCTIVFILGGNARALGRATPIGLIGGAIVGNLLWAKLFQPPTPPPSIRQ
jgi:hypothetical protein